MSCGIHQQYLAPKDMAMIERVLAHPDLRRQSDSLALRCGAAKFLVRKFQEGMTDEVEMTIVLARYLRIWRAWRSRPQRSTKTPSSDDHLLSSAREMSGFAA